MCREVPQEAPSERGLEMEGTEANSGSVSEQVAVVGSWGSVLLKTLAHSLEHATEKS